MSPIKKSTPEELLGVHGLAHLQVRPHMYSSERLNTSLRQGYTAGVMQARYDYDPYGRQTLISGTINDDFGYAGMYVHASSGLNLTLYRAYNSDLGRWLSCDPSGEQSSLNLFDYVYNNPINLIDSLGLEGGDAEAQAPQNGSQVNGVPVENISAPLDSGTCGKGGPLTVSNNDSDEELAMMMMAGGGITIAGAALALPEVVGAASEAAGTVAASGPQVVGQVLIGVGVGSAIYLIIKNSADDPDGPPEYPEGNPEQVYGHENNPVPAPPAGTIQLECQFS
jgi:RHS repeat-associated protein